MANPEHLAILKQGTVQWNEWREDHPEVGRPDLAETSLRDAALDLANFAAADLSGADLNGASLRSANLGEANLDWADLSNANLDWANLRGANLECAKLILTELIGADLSGANLSRTELRWASLREAKLRGTEFTGARAAGTQLGNVDLSATKGLETVVHEGPSTVGIDTLYNSHGKIPEVFLRGCGVPEEFIEFARSIGRNPIEFYSCFISYAHEDKLFARRLHDALQGRGVRCWLDEKQMLPGDDIYEQVDRGIRL